MLALIQDLPFFGIAMSGLLEGEKHDDRQIMLVNMLMDEDDDGWLMRIILAKTEQHDTGVGEGGWKC